MMKDDTSEPEDCVFAALETGARLRGRESATTGSPAPADAVARTIAVIEAETTRIQAHDLSAVETVLASQALALDALFVQLARSSALDRQLWPEPLRLALKAQSQSRVTLSSLLSLIHSRSNAPSGRRMRNSSEQTVENGNSHS
jgi:hypothetical protein